MTNLSQLTLTEKIKQARRGDIVVTDSGARLPFYKNHEDGDLTVSICNHIAHYIPHHAITDIIRPSKAKREVSEIVEQLRNVSWKNIMINGELYKECNMDVVELSHILADHFEKDAQK